MRFLKTEHYEGIDPQLAAIDPKRFIDFQSAEDVLAKRQKLIRFIWKSEELPKSGPTLVEEGIKTDKFGSSAADRIDRITVQMEHGFDSKVYILHPAPEKKNNKVLIYHNGHGEEIRSANFFVGNGFTVLYFTLPLAEENAAPERLFSRTRGEIIIKSHKDFEYLVSDEFNPIKLFLEPLNASMNYMEQFGYEDIAMVGLSGGGWATGLYAAIDPRIKKSYPVAGTLPIYLRGERGYGDWEEQFHELYSLATYLELYVMGALGRGRSQLQIFNQYDKCCFSGIESLLYENAVRETVISFGQGGFNIFIDSSHREHKISDPALSLILEDIQMQL